MKKTLLTLAFILLLNGFAQAQTKEETITWLKEKLSNYLKKGDIYYGTYTNIKLESLDECEFKISYTERQIFESYPKTDITKYYRITAPTTIKEITSYFKFDIKLVKTNSKGYGTMATWPPQNLTYNEVNDFHDFIPLQIEEREAGIRERVEKAFKHLATFCPKKKETF